MKKFDLKKFRQSKNQTQTELASLLGVSRSIVAKIENGNTDLSKKMFEKLIKIFPNDFNFLSEAYKNAHLFTHPNTHQIDEIKKLFDKTIGINSSEEKNLDNKDVDYTFYYIQNREYEMMQQWLFNIVKLLAFQFNRKFNEKELNELYLCMTNIQPTSYIKSLGEISVNKFLKERTANTKCLIDKYLNEFYNKSIEKNPQIDNLDFLNT